MSRIIKATVVASLLSFSALCLVAVFALRVPVQAGGGAVASQNGDVNGDGQLDVSDAVYTLLYLFKGGPEPVAVADSPELVDRVVALEEGFADLLGSIDTKLERIAVAAEAALEMPCEGRIDRFEDNRDGTVTDTCTGRMWSQTGVDVNEDGVFSNDEFTYEETMAIVADLDLGGHSDWRVPTIHELGMIAKEDEGGQWRPGVDPTFGVSPTNAYWSSSVLADDANQIWVMRFYAADKMLNTNSAPRRSTLARATRLPFLVVR